MFMVPVTTVLTGRTILSDKEQLLVSVTVTKYVLASSPEAVAVKAPFDHRYVNAPFPPLALTATSPSLKGAQL